MTGVPDTAHHDGPRTVVRRVLWLAGVLLGLWLLSWIVAGEARADGLPLHIPVVDQVVQPVVGHVVPDVGKVLDPVTKPVGKVLRGLEIGPVQDLLKSVGKVVDALPAPLPDLVTPILQPVGSVGETVGGLTPQPGTALPASPVPAKVKPAGATPSVNPAETAPVNVTAKTSVQTAAGNDFRIALPAKARTSKAETSQTLPVSQAAQRQGIRHLPASERPDAPGEPGSAPVTTGGSVVMAAVVGHDGASGLTAPGRLVRPHGVFAPLWRSLKPGTSPG